jgi:PAS domain S-box-containing protein
MNHSEPAHPAQLDGESQHRYLQFVLHAIPVGVVVVDDRLIVQAFNPAAERITGIAAGEAVGLPYSDVLHTERQDIADPLVEALETGQTFVNQRFYLRPPEAGEPLPIRHSASVLTDEEGRVVGGVTVFADISRQVFLEQQLEGQRRYLRDVLRSIPDGVATLDAGCIVQSWNDGAVRITGRAAPDAIGRPCDEVLGPAIGAALEALFQGEEGMVQRMEARLPVNGEQALPVAFSANRLTTLDRSDPGAVVVFQDISERLSQTRQILQQRHYLQQVLELAPYGIFTVDEELVIQTFNRAAERLTGYADSFAVGRPYHEVLKLDPDAGPDPLPDLLASDERRTAVRLKLIDAGGKKLPIRYGAAPLTDVEDQVIGGIVIFQDIGDIVAAERTKDEFVSMVSHELRTPLTSIKGFVTAVLDGRAGEINERQRHFLSISQEESNHLLHLVNDLLDLSRMEAGQMELDRSRIDVAALVEQAVRVIGPLARRRQITLEWDVAPALPYLWADEGQMLQVLRNLLSNAIKFTPPEGHVALQARLADEECLVLEVNDSGIGIAPEDQDRIFEPFYQVERVQTRQAGGTGLGLPIVQRIIEAHGGQVEVESAPGVGSTFRVTLPLSHAAALAVHSRPDEERMAELPQPRREPRVRPERLNPLILVVDDNPSANALIRFTLESEGYDVVGATGGQEALELAVAHQPDLITLDILMPELDGFGVLERLKENPEVADIPVCIVSIVEDKARGYRLGAIDYITKPFEREDLVHAVHSVLEPVEGERPARVLVVEDDPALIELIELSLADEGLQVLSACDGVAALERLRHDRPHLVLLDIMIPKLDGYEFIRQAKSDPRTADVPIIVLSVRALEEDISRALRLGAEKYLTKPPVVGGDFSDVILDLVSKTLADEADEREEK